MAPIRVMGDKEGKVKEQGFLGTKIKTIYQGHGNFAKRLCSFPLKCIAVMFVVAVHSVVVWFHPYE